MNHDSANQERALTHIGRQNIKIVGVKCILRKKREMHYARYYLRCTYTLSIYVLQNINNVIVTNYEFNVYKITLRTGSSKSELAKISELRIQKMCY